MINEHIEKLKEKIKDWPIYKQRILKEKHLNEIYSDEFKGKIKEFSLTIEDIRCAIRGTVDLDLFKCPFCGKQLHIYNNHFKPDHCGDYDCKNKFYYLRRFRRMFLNK